MIETLRDEGTGIPQIRMHGAEVLAIRHLRKLSFVVNGRLD